MIIRFVGAEQRTHKKKECLPTLLISGETKSFDRVKNLRVSNLRAILQPFVLPNGPRDPVFLEHLPDPGYAVTQIDEINLESRNIVMPINENPKNGWTSLVGVTAHALSR